MAGLVFLVIFFGIVIALIAIAIYGSKKDKQKRLLNVAEWKENDNLSKDRHIYLYLRLNYILENLEEDLNDFKPSVGTKTIGSINKQAYDMIKEISESEDLKNVYLINERRDEFKPIIDSFLQIQPSKWEREAFFAYNLVKNKSEAFKKTDYYEHYQKEIIQDPWV